MEKQEPPGLFSYDYIIIDDESRRGLAECLRLAADAVELHRLDTIEPQPKLGTELGS